MCCFQAMFCIVEQLALINIRVPFQRFEMHNVFKKCVKNHGRCIEKVHFNTWLCFINVGFK